MFPSFNIAPGSRLRARDGGFLLRHRRRILRVTRCTHPELALRAAAPANFPRVVGAFSHDGQTWLIESPPRGKRLDHLPRAAAPFGALALVAWRLASAGHSPRELDLRQLMLDLGEPTLLAVPVSATDAQCAQSLAFLGAALLGRRPTAALKPPALGDLVARALGTPAAANTLLRSALMPLPDVAALRGWCGAALRLALDDGLPVVLPAPDAESASALAALLAANALESGVALLPESTQAPGGVRLIHAVNVDTAEHQLARQRGPALCIVQAARTDAESALGHVAQVVAWPAPRRAALVGWLRGLHAAPELVSELLLPVLERDSFGARRLVLALIERAGARMENGVPVLDAAWPAELRAMTASRRVDVVHPGAARLALLVALSPGGLDSAAVESNADLRRAGELLVATGLIARHGQALTALASLPAPTAEPAVRRAALLWLSEREHFCPWQDATRRRAWCAALRLRSGDLGAWADARCEDLFTELWQAHQFDDALLLCEAHATTAGRFGAGPPAVQVTIAARDVAMAQWPPRRARRLLRLWLRGYHGDWRAHLLGLLALIERQLSGPEGYSPLVDQVARLAPGLPRLPREQALIAAAHASCFEEPARALELLRGVGDQPAQAATLASNTRVLFIRAECEFIAIHLDGALSFVHQALESLPPRAYLPIRQRWEIELESMQVTVHGVANRFDRSVDDSLQPLRELQVRHGCGRDIVARTLVNQQLFRLRLREIGSLSDADAEAVLAEARPDNLRGYMIVLYQLAENAAYRGDGDLVRRLGARLSALNAPHISPMAWAGWVRHEALRLALTADFQGARRWWRQSAVWQLAEPWRTRMGHLRLGERGVLRLMAGKFESALKDLRAASRRLSQMSAGARASSFFSLALVIELLLGRKPLTSDIEDLESLGTHGFEMPRLAAQLARAAQSGAWSRFTDVVETAACPPLWKSFLLGAAAMVARKSGAREAATLAVAANDLAPADAPLVREWIAREFPAGRAVAQDLPAPVLAALANLHADPLRPPAPLQLLQSAVLALQTVCNAQAAGLLAHGGEFFGIATLREACERAQLEGESELPHEVAIPLPGCGGALAVAAGSHALPALRAVGARLDELVWIAESRSEREGARRRNRALASAAWALGAEENFAARLHALAGLCAAESGAGAVELALLRRGNVLMATTRLAEPVVEIARRVDDVLTLRLRASGGDRELLEQACAESARAVASALRRAPDALRNELGRADQGETVYAAGEPLGASPAAARLAQDIRRYADLDLAVVITGPGGSGKDLVARALHQASQRSGAPMVTVDCTTLRVETAASELFGHVRGAFTGANTDHVGLLESAGSGTLQLDNPGELAAPIQAMLLRAMQQRRFLPVGGLREHALAARLVVTSVLPMDELAEAGRLRPDLAQRLAGLNLRVPALGERGQDALWLARHFTREVGIQFGRRVRLGPAAERFIAEHPWPGNVRQLRASIARAAALCTGGMITPDDLAQDNSTQPGSILRLPRDVPGLTTAGRLVLASLRELGDAASLDLVQRLGLSRTTVSTALSDLARKGLATRTGKARSTRYTAQG